MVEKTINIKAVEKYGPAILSFNLMKFKIGAVTGEKQFKKNVFKLASFQNHNI